METAEQLIGRTARPILKARRWRSVWQWAESNVVLDIRSTNFPGRYDSALTPYARAWQDAFCKLRVRRVVICKSVQTAGTESLLNMLRFCIAEDPGPVLWGMPSETLAKSFSEVRLQPSLRSCKMCAAKIGTDPDKFKLLEMHLRDCMVNLVGSNSPANLASRPVRYLFADEIDKWAEPSAKEAAALDLARARLTTYWNNKEVCTSTPTLTNRGVWLEYLAGNQQRYFVPCPFCGTMQALYFGPKSIFAKTGAGGIKWPRDDRTYRDGKWIEDAVEKLAFYECESCQRPIAHHHKSQMVLRGEYRPQNPSAPEDVESFHISALYSPFRSWGWIAKRFLQVRDKFGGLQDFANSVLGEPFDPGKVYESKPIILSAAPVAQWIESPHDFRFVTVDVQARGFWSVIRDWFKDGTSRMIWSGELRHWGDIIELAEKYKVANSRHVFCDSRYVMKEVHRECAKNGWTALMGEDRRAYVHRDEGEKETIQRIYSDMRMCDPGIGTSSEGQRACAEFAFADPSAKDMLAWLRGGSGPKWEVPADASDEYKRQMDGEVYDPNKNEWVRVGPNHLFDCEKMQVVAASMAEIIWELPKEEKEHSK